MTCSWTPVRLGRTDLTVCPFGITAQVGVSASALERAHERGVNLIFWNSICIDDASKAVRRLAARDRGSLTLAAQIHAQSLSSITKALDKQLRVLATDHVDILVLMWWIGRPPKATLDAAAELVRLGRAKSVMVASDDRPLFKKLAADPRVDLLMTRYDAMYADADQDLFPHLPAPRQGMVSTHSETSSSRILDPACAPDEKRPTLSDCYRFILSNPNVDVFCTAPTSEEQLDAALHALDEAPMTEDELAWMRRIGAAAKIRLHG